MSRTISPKLLAGLRALPERPAVAEAVASMQRAGIAAESFGLAAIRAQYAYQSFFSATLIERGLLAQNVAEPIVPSTKNIEPTPGYGVALYPASEAPVAVQLLMGGGKSGSATFVLKPGDVYLSKSRFDAVAYGLPNGWLGGGAVQLRVLQQRDDVRFPPVMPELCFHRIRLPIWSVSANPAASGRGTSANWPIRFPWTNATDQNGNPQAGQPALGVTPTHTVFRVRSAITAPGGRLRFVLLKSDDLDLQSDNVTLDTIGTSGSWFDIQFGTSAASGFQIGGVATAEFQTVVQRDDITALLGGDSAIAILLDMDGVMGGDTTLTNASKCDVERFGYL